MPGLPHLMGMTKKVLKERQAEIKARMLALKSRPKKKAAAKRVPVREKLSAAISAT